MSRGSNLGSITSTGRSQTTVVGSGKLRVITITKPATYSRQWADGNMEDSSMVLTNIAKL